MAYSNRGVRTVQQREHELLLRLALRASKAVRELESAAYKSFTLSSRDYSLALKAEVAVSKIVRRILNKGEVC